jgi:hypothetical protein
MSQTVHGVISRSKGAPVEVTDIVIPDPGPGEVVVKIITRGGGPHRPDLPPRLLMHAGEVLRSVVMLP